MRQYSPLVETRGLFFYGGFSTTRMIIIQIRPNIRERLKAFKLMTNSLELSNSEEMITNSGPLPIGIIFANSIRKNSDGKWDDECPWKPDHSFDKSY